MDPRLRNFGLAPGWGPDIATIARAGRRRRRLRHLVPVATAAVLALILTSIAFIVLQDRTVQMTPLRPMPLPTSTTTVIPPQFDVDDAPANGEPAYGLGEVDDGLRVEGATFETAPCPDGVECPIAITLEVTNTRPTAFGGGIIVTVYRNGLELTGSGTGTQVQPGATEMVQIVLDPATTSIPTATDGPGVYTWNWKLERMR